MSETFTAFCYQCGPEGMCTGCQKQKENVTSYRKSVLVKLDNIKKICGLVASDDFEHGTADPIFLVQQKIRNYGIESGYEEGCEWFDKDRQEIVEGLRAQRLSLLECDLRDVPKKYVKILYQERWEFVTCCFTREGAENFINRQKHNLKETRIWVDSLYRNQEMIGIRNMLKSIGESK